MQSSVFPASLRPFSRSKMSSLQNHTSHLPPFVSLIIVALYLSFLIETEAQACRCSLKVLHLVPIWSLHYDIFFLDEIIQPRYINYTFRTPFMNVMKISQSPTSSLNWLQRCFKTSALFKKRWTIHVPFEC